MSTTLFLSHGAPTLALEPTPAHHFLKTLSRQVEPPSAIIVVSAHWECPQPTLTAHPQPDTVHDFSGFPAPLYQLQYPASGQPGLALQITDSLRQQGWDARLDARRGLDHGVWVPLSLAWPTAEVPVIQLSLIARADAQTHYALGRALGAAVGLDVLVVGSGGLSHNLSQYRGQSVDAPTPEWAREFEEWAFDVLTEGKTDDLLEWKHRAPHALKNHPTPDHWLPLLVAYGAAGAGARGEAMYRGFEYGVLGMDAWRFT